jgi:apolipoprotein N-acyltransferase
VTDEEFEQFRAKARRRVLLERRKDVVVSGVISAALVVLSMAVFATWWSYWVEAT